MDGRRQGNGPTTIPGVPAAVWSGSIRAAAGPVAVCPAAQSPALFAECAADAAVWRGAAPKSFVSVGSAGAAAAPAQASRRAVDRAGRGAIDRGCARARADLRGCDFDGAALVGASRAGR